jgi:hypothetical protein
MKHPKGSKKRKILKIKRIPKAWADTPVEVLPEPVHDLFRAVHEGHVKEIVFADDLPDPSLWERLKKWFMEPTD